MTRWQNVKALTKSLFGYNPAGEGNYNPAAGWSECGNPFLLSSNDGTGWQRNLTTSHHDRILIVAAIIRAYAWALASSGLQHIRHLPEGGIEILKNGAVERLLRYPNEYQHQINFIEQAVWSIFYYGNFYAHAQRNGRFEITALHPLPSHHHRAVMAEDGSVFYDVSGDFEFMRDRSDISRLAPARDVLHVKLASKRSVLHGESPLADAGATLFLNQATLANSAAFHANKRQPSGILSVDMALSPQQMQDLRKAFDNQTTGVNSGGVPILGAGTKWYPMGMTASDAQLVETYSMSVLDLCRLFRIPPQLLGLNETGTASGIEPLINQWRATGLLFHAENIERSLERLLELPANEEIRFDLNNLARANFKDLIEALSKSVQNGMHSPNEARNEVGLQPVAFGDEPRVQAQNVRLQDAVPAQVAPSAGKVEAPSNKPTGGDIGEEDDTEKSWASHVVAVAAIEKAMRGEP